MLLVPKETLSEATIPLSLEEQRRGQHYYLQNGTQCTALLLSCLLLSLALSMYSFRNFKNYCTNKWGFAVIFQMNAIKEIKLHKKMKEYFKQLLKFLVWVN